MAFKSTVTTLLKYDVQVECETCKKQNNLGTVYVKPDSDTKDLSLAVRDKAESKGYFIITDKDYYLRTYCNKCFKTKQ